MGRGGVWQGLSRVLAGFTEFEISHFELFHGLFFISVQAHGIALCLKSGIQFSRVTLVFSGLRPRIYTS